MNKHDNKNWKADTWDVSEAVKIPKGSKAVMDDDWCVAIVLADNDKPVDFRVSLIAAAPELLTLLDESRDCVAELANYEAEHESHRPDRAINTMRLLARIDEVLDKLQ